ncbi:antibiotic biosynthesis monooxygenase family protein [Pseudonocardia sp. TRM90224]|uniref:antibiotic biosynthesis monooxygenase family protein n=1 Tax=Pseudonocardia sp. TRM90224 TaxID=2812678 RepID=UPI001E2B7230|nr:hypothetical protein [Pseudonocardia sp. TRM90224]
MVARIWNAKATEEGARRYHEHFVGAVQPALEGTSGFRGAMLLERAGDEGVDIQVVTLWESLDAIRNFAGADIDTAVVEQAAQEALLTFDKKVTHHTVTAQV